MHDMEHTEEQRYVIIGVFDNSTHKADRCMPSIRWVMCSYMPPFSTSVVTRVLVFHECTKRPGSTQRNCERDRAFQCSSGC